MLGGGGERCIFLTEISGGGRVRLVGEAVGKEWKKQVVTSASTGES